MADWREAAAKKHAKLKETKPRKGKILTYDDALSIKITERQSLQIKRIAKAFGAGYSATAKDVVDFGLAFVKLWEERYGIKPLEDDIPL